MRKLRRVLLISAMVIYLGLSGISVYSAEPEGDKGSAESEASTLRSEAVKKAGGEIISYFGPVEGVVSSVVNGKVKVSVPEGKRLRAGMRLSVFKKGKPFYHPVTKEKIGNAESYAGRIELLYAGTSDGEYGCKLISGEVNSGDVVRITSSKIKLAFFQDRKSDWAISEVFYDFLKDSGRFEVLETYTPDYSPEELSKLSKKLGAEAIVMLSTPVKDEKKYLNAKLYWAEDARKFDELEEAVRLETVRMLTEGDSFIMDAMSDIEPWGNYPITDGELMAMGDVNGNGERELVISNGYEIKIYDLKKELQVVWTYKDNLRDKHISLDILDLNNNGVSEIFVTVLANAKQRDVVEGIGILSDNRNVYSYAIEYSPAEGYRKITGKTPYFLRVSGRSLLMQKYSTGDIFSGPVYKGEWREGHYGVAEPLKLPEGVNIYGFTYVDWMNDGQINLVSLDDRGYLNIYNDRGDFLWKSEESFGFYEFLFKKDFYTTDDSEEMWAVRGRLLAVNTDRGQEVVVIKRIPVFDKLPRLGNRGAEVYTVWWDGAEADQSLVLNEVAGSITDYWVEGMRLFLVAKGDMISLVKNAVEGEFVRGNTLYFYNLGER